MIPSNTPITPEIKNIADNQNVKHTVIPSDHTHEMSEVEGLTTALASKANTVGAGSPTGGIVIANTSGELLRSDKTLNDLMPAKDIDTEPTQNSQNLITSGAVYSGLAGKMDNRQFDSDPTLNSTKLVTSGNIRKAMNAVGAIQIRGVIEDPSFVVAFENYSQWWSNGETELHYIMKKTSGSPVAVKTQFRSNTGIVYFADDLGDVSPSRWPIVTIRRGPNGTTPIFTVTLDGVYTPTT